MNVHVMMIARNEVDRHLARALECAAEVASRGKGHVLFTDDGSTDGTDMLADSVGAVVNRFEEPLFWRNEGAARQRHLEFVARNVMPGDWILSLDADETVNRPDLAVRNAKLADSRGNLAVLMPLYEFWNDRPLQYRTDGYWFGTRASRLFKWMPGGHIQEREFASGSEPTYVSDAVRAGNVLNQEELHLLHWGYIREGDRTRKHKLYTERDGGHGHNNAHVNSIIGEPRLAHYNGGIL